MSLITNSKENKFWGLEYDQSSSSESDSDVETKINVNNSWNYDESDSSDSDTEKRFVRSKSRKIIDDLNTRSNIIYDYAEKDNYSKVYENLNKLSCKFNFVKNKPDIDKYITEDVIRCIHTLNEKTNDTTIKNKLSKNNNKFLNKLKFTLLKDMIDKLKNSEKFIICFVFWIIH